ncbi:hypothetical protein A1F94_011679 [Pyrenophora tritici-repentis]|uniref:Uncharacterized protein n=1 Tax=Pyrenophora tritici-repentis TaxID=45151 RepID=A0A2W1HI15_9PLEO|nr:hypothetical protein PtrV1_00554 [Pyrenophora tritici-repentis]KAF7453269.1 hypothetical protein A1F99_005270 [Pyrenophora tritici-repentis]KAF7576332.1 hypothetical protein PtrM4_005720 [Pyrenophora tritici-repentis]KAG9377276.1 hypothetical protein A1F94_011679 [Pyrenophora tritici-repentis]KAI0584918.1 hypothetical protein Alg215_02785 [Pyrenophora tritici-repentis]
MVPQIFKAPLERMKTVVVCAWPEVQGTLQNGLECGLVDVEVLCESGKGRSGFEAATRVVHAGTTGYKT